MDRAAARVGEGRSDVDQVARLREVEQAATSQIERAEGQDTGCPRRPARRSRQWRASPRPAAEPTDPLASTPLVMLTGPLPVAEPLVLVSRSLPAVDVVPPL